MNSNLPHSQNSTDWIVVYITHDVRDAHIIAGHLKHENIPHLVHTQPGASAIGITLGRMGEIKVLVRPEDYDEAVALLFPDDDEDPLPELEEDTDYIQGLDADDEQ